MLTPERSLICTSTKMDAAFQYFMCGLCNHLVTPMRYENAPYAMQCVACHSLCCEACVRTTLIWMCPQSLCKTK